MGGGFAMTVRFRPSEPGPNECLVTGGKVQLQCQDCDWTKAVWREKAYASLRGHYSYRHPGLVLPDGRDLQRALRR